MVYTGISLCIQNNRQDDVVKNILLLVLLLGNTEVPLGFLGANPKGNNKKKKDWSVSDMLQST